MNDVLEKAIGGLLLLLMTILGLLYRGTIKRLDILEAEAVRTKELDSREQQRMQQHIDNCARLDRIDSSISGIHKRVDDLFRELVK